MIRRPSLYSMMAVFAYTLSGCSGGEHEDVKQWMADSSRDMRGSVPPLPELKPFPVVAYSSSNQADPFSNSRIEQDKTEALGGLKPDLNRPKEQLELFPLETLRYMGRVTNKREQKDYALIMVDAVMYQARIGNYAGENFGRIVAINDSEIRLVETVQDPTGRTRDWVEREQTLLLDSGAGKEGNK